MANKFWWFVKQVVDSLSEKHKVGIARTRQDGSEWVYLDYNTNKVDTIDCETKAEHQLLYIIQKLTRQ